MLKHGTFIILFLFAASGLAQSGTASPYSFNGLGEISFRGNQINRMMGGLDIYNDSIHANLNNPASYGTLKLTNYALGINYRSNELSSEEGTEKIATASIDYLAVGIPAGKFGFGFGITPYSSLGYQLEALNDTTTPNKLNRFEGSGGINQAFFSIGFPLSKYLTFGTTINYNFGNLTYRNSQFVDGVDLGTFLSSRSSISGVSYQFSTNINIPLKKRHELTAMFTYIPAATLTSQNEKAYFTQSLLGNTISDVEEIDLAPEGLTETNLMASENIRYGIGVGKRKKWFLGAQQNLIKSANFKNDFIEMDNVSYKNGKQLSVGGFFIPNFSSISSYWKRVVYRFGFRSEQTGVLVNNYEITDSGISFGIGLPMNGLSNTNIGFEIGKKGSKNDNSLKETYWALRIGFSLNDLWFVKRKYN